MTTTINEVDLYDQRIYNETEAIMKQRVAKSTRESYGRIEITFILWLFDHYKKYPSLLKHKLYNMMKKNISEDISQMTTQCKRSKSRYGIQAVLCEALQKIKT